MSKQTADTLRVAGIDVGSSAVKVVILEDTEGQPPKLLVNRRERVRRRDPSDVTHSLFDACLSEAGLRRDDVVSVIDVAPTLVTLAGLSVPSTMDGRALFAGGGEGRPRAPYAESLYGWESSRWAQVFALRTGGRKLVDAGPRTSS